MLNFGKKIRTLRDKKNNILTLLLSEKKILNETKNHNPTPFKLNGRSLSNIFICIKNLNFNQHITTKVILIGSPVFHF